MSGNAQILIGLIPLLLVVVAFVLSGRYMRRRGYMSRGGTDVIVRCSAGHLFTTVWVPLVSFKAIRLGPIRYQYCPVGNHWTFVFPVNESELSDAERRFAAEHHDKRIP
jgi:hypothetical protein